MTTTVCLPSIDDALHGRGPSEWHHASTLAALTLTLVPTPNAVVCGELLVRRAASDCHLDRGATNAGVVAMTDLINHSVTMTSLPDTVAKSGSDFGRLPLIEVGVSVCPDRLILALREPSATPVSGSKLGRAATDSDDWGTYELSDGDRIVWCVHRLWPSATVVHPDAGLPRRVVPSDRPQSAPAEPPVDRDVLLRVLEGLHKLDLSSAAKSA